MSEISLILLSLFLTYCLRRSRCRAIAAVATATATPAAVTAATAMNAVSVAVTAICWLIVVCPHHCLRCLPPSLPLLAADVIGNGGDCGNGCGGNGGSGNNGAFRSFSGLMFKILHIKSNILNIKLDEEGGDCRMDGPVD